MKTEKLRLINSFKINYNFNEKYTSKTKMIRAKSSTILIFKKFFNV